MLQAPGKRKAFPKTLLLSGLTPSAGGNTHGTSPSSLTCLGQENMGEQGFKQGFKHQSRALLMSWQVGCPCLSDPKLP